MTGFLAPFFIAFGIGAGIAALLTIIAAVSVTARELLLLVWGLAKETVTMPRTFWCAIKEGWEEGGRRDRERQERKAKR
ncbi:hypothetical protein [Ectothiorhodospira mobilis]|uniref:hypothetical protein n=1 Tax=Ectothiorhodospira mobilis TaxID=195064 RepID=UPI00190556C3|nr:hypothetical protein [Ectothiorhodospira mobilis]MBK1691201.1 hypothetical protein [Ectothiorhodospira mobilis]